jgi:hypothetical protein
MKTQKVEKGSQAIQAGRDVNIGLLYSDVKEIVFDLFKQNFPELVAEATEQAKKNIEDYENTLEKTIKRKLGEIDINKFKEPNTQFLLNKSIGIAARKGKGIDLEMLTETLLSGIRKEDSDLLNIVAEQALDAIPKLTASQINLISIVQFILYMRFQGLADYSIAEPNNNIVKQITNSVGEPNHLQLSYMASFGVITINQFQGINPYDAIKQQYDYLFSEKNTEEVKKIIEEKSLSMKELVDKYEKFNLRIINLTPVGILIALINLRRLFPQIDYRIWIK